jgi:hypothetical protein
MMTPKIRASQPTSGVLALEIDAWGFIDGETVSFYLPMRQESFLAERDTVQVTLDNHKETIYASVTEKAFDPDAQMIVVTARLRSYKGEVYDGQQARVAFYQSLGQYDLIVPRGCLFYEGGGPCVYAVEMVSGILGESYVAWRVAVSVMEEDAFNAAISGQIYFNQGLVRYTNKPLRNGIKVLFDE